MISLRRLMRGLLNRENYYLSNYEIFKYSPYNILIYEDYINKIFKKNDILIQDIRNINCVDKKNINFFFRHDIDTNHCIKNISLLVDIDFKYNIKSGIYFLVDGSEYDLKDYKQEIFKYRDKGFEIGLHTVCYVKENFMDEFERENEIFYKKLGFRPISFSIHGLGSYKIENRIKFKKLISKQLLNFGYFFSDSIMSNVYNHVIHDCHLQEQNRYI